MPAAVKITRLREVLDSADDPALTELAASTSCPAWVSDLAATAVAVVKDKSLDRTAKRRKIEQLLSLLDEKTASESNPTQESLPQRRRAPGRKAATARPAGKNPAAQFVKQMREGSPDPAATPTPTSPAKPQLSTDAFVAGLRAQADGFYLT